MSWLLNLYETYEKNENEVGKTVKKRNESTYMLLPISHTTQNAHVEVTLDEEGNYLSSKVLEKENTVIPCTESSASRSGSLVAPYPLHDKLSYVAGDYLKYGGEIKDPDKVPFEEYIKNLKEWAESEYATKKLISIYKYQKKGKLIEDLVEHNVLFVDEGNKLIEKWNPIYEKKYGEKPAIFSSGATDQYSVFVRFNVYSDDLQDVWNDSEMHSSFINFYNGKIGANDIDYITGRESPATERHSNKIRHAADKAKLISSNDTSGYTYRGRFHTSKEAVGISYDVSQKAHNALKWLIHRQGKIVDDCVFLVWGNDNQTIANVTEDSWDIIQHVNRETEEAIDTAQEFAKKVRRAIDGYRSDLAYPNAEVNILILDSATTGRLAVLYYRNMNKELYLNHLEEWHSTCAWEQRYRKKDGSPVLFYGAPSTEDIAFAAYGPRANNKMVKGLMQRLIPSIVDGRKVPSDIVRSVFYRASNPVAMEKWEWEKTLTIACALIRKKYIEKKEVMDVALDKTIEDRNYLFGRLLAVADVLERSALGTDEKRSTNAIRYMNAFSQNPARTWLTIQRALQPYQARLGTKATYLSKIMDEIGDQFNIEDFDNKPLNEKYLLGFYSQRRELYKKKNENNESEEMEA